MNFNDKTDPMIQTRTPTIDLDEIRAIKDAARAITSEYNEQFLSAPELLHRLTNDRRQANIEAVRNYVEWKEAADFRDDLVHRFVELRKALQSILDVAQHGGSVELERIMADASEALKLDDGQDEYMQSEFGYGVDEVLQRATEAARGGDLRCGCIRCHADSTSLS